jgi:hypothetical protein
MSWTNILHTYCFIYFLDSCLRGTIAYHCPHCSCPKLDHPNLAKATRQHPRAMHYTFIHALITPSKFFIRPSRKPQQIQNRIQHPKGHNLSSKAFLPANTLQKLLITKALNHKGDRSQAKQKRKRATKPTVHSVPTSTRPQVHESAGCRVADTSQITEI